MKKLLASIITVCIFLTASLAVFADDIEENEPFKETFKSDYQASTPPVVDAGSAIVIEQKTGRILYQRDAYRKRPMASTTKIMTAIVALENGNLDDIVTVSRNAASIWGSKIHIREGERYTLKELLYGLMLNSGNDAAIAIAEHIGGTEEHFMEMMNAKAAELGARDTGFKTPHGLDAPGHYTTAYDLALITAYALENPAFSEIVGTKATSISGISLYNTNEMLSSYPGADGVKTGYTGQAGRCLVTSATRDGMRLISVVLYCSSRYARASSTAKILDYSFYNFKPVNLARNGEIVAALPVIKGELPNIKIAAGENTIYPLRDDELASMEKKIFLPRKLKAPIVKGDTIGSMEYLVDGCLIANTPLVASADIRKKSVLDYVREVVFSWSKVMHEGMFYELAK